MKEHALPQDIVGYRFHLIGNMTLKQFAEVAAGCIIGFFIYQTNLPTFIKWPLILMTAGIGALAAFIPFEERPLDHWITQFVKAIYRPTQFYWQKVIKIPEPFLHETKSELRTIINDVDLSPARRQRVKEFLRSIETPEELDDVEKYNQQRLGEVAFLFTGESTEQPEVVPDLTFADFSPQVQEYPLSPSSPTTESPPTEEVSSFSLPVAADTVLGEEQTQDWQEVAAAPIITQPTAFTLNTSDLTAMTASDSLSPKTPSSPSPSSNSAVVIPNASQVRIQPVDAISINTTTDDNTAPPPLQTQAFVQDIKLANAPSDAVPIILNPDLPFPSQPDEVNKLIGMVFDPSQTPLPGAIVEILTPAGESVRAVKTNTLGQFFITTPLPNGEYFLKAEKDNLFSPSYFFSLTNQIIPSVEVRTSQLDNEGTATMPTVAQIV